MNREFVFPSGDGTELFYRAWTPSAPARRALLLIHRGHEHSGRWQETVDALDLKDVAAFAWDARGHGRSPGERGYAKDMGVVVRDLDAFVRHVATQHGIPVENMAVLAQSVGAVTAAAWVHDYAPPLCGLVLAVPAFRVKLYVPFAVPLLRIRQRFLGPGYVKSYVKARMLTHDPEQAALYQQDPLIFRQIAVNVLLDLHDTSTRLMADAGAVQVPTLVLAAGSDWVVRVSAERAFFDGLSSAAKRWEMLPGFYHAIFHEKDRRLAIEKTRAFLNACFADVTQARTTHAALLDADRQGHTKREYDGLRAPGGLRFAPVRLAMKTGGRLSEGIRLGWRAGFDSGTMLDYVYENRSRGITPLGRWIDRAFLNSIGWRGIRLRKTHLRTLLGAAMEKVHTEGRPVRILDIASGPGRYVLETLHALGSISSTALLRDYKEENVDAARRLAATLGLTGVVCEKGDAFDRASLATLRPRPTIAVVSGLYELFPENGPVRESLGGLADALEPGDYLLYTNQPWHPQLTFIARVLTNREGQPWIMRRRTQAEMDALVRAAGFEKLRQEIDPWGVFSVSLARRMSG